MTEAQLQNAVCKHLTKNYPDIIFASEPAGLRVSKRKASGLKLIRSEAALPDLMIFEPMGVYKGLFLELKVKSVWLKDGTLTIDKHVREQSEILKRLRAKGYLATFACGFDEAKEIIDYYLAESLITIDQLELSIDLGAKINYLDTI